MAEAVLGRGESRLELSAAEMEVVVESAVVAGLAGLLGLALGRLWDRRSESSRWRRDQQIRCYEHLFGTYYELRDQLRALGAADPAGPNR